MVLMEGKLRLKNQRSKACGEGASERKAHILMSGARKIFCVIERGQDELVASGGRSREVGRLSRTISSYRGKLWTGFKRESDSLA
jgi:hypothetical protein